MTELLKHEENLHIKADPDSEMPISTADDFGYEDTGELEMPSAKIDAWLLRLPKDLYESWAKLPNDQPIQLGHVRHFAKNDRVRQRTQISLNIS